MCARIVGGASQQRHSSVAIIMFKMAVMKLGLVLLACIFIIRGASAADWLIHKVTSKATCYQISDNILVLTNGLISRTFSLNDPGFVTTNYRSEVQSRSILRAILPEAYVTLDGTQYPIGGVMQSGPHSYLNNSSPNMNVLPRSFQFTDYQILKPDTPFHWEPGYRHSPANISWPPEGITLDVLFNAPQDVAIPSHADVRVHIKYEIYEGIPVLAKWLTVENKGDTPVRVDAVTVENLGTQKPYAPLDFTAHPRPWENDGSAVTSSWLYVEATDAHGPSISWTKDPKTSAGADEPLLTVSYSIGPGVILGQVPLKKNFNTGRFQKEADNTLLPSFDTFRVLELVVDSNDRERVGLSHHRMTRLLAPQTQENPIYFHCTNVTDAGIKAAIDQMEQVGFEMFVYRGYGFSLEDIREEHMKKVAANVAYAKSKGMEVGGYDLIDLARGDGSYGGNVGDIWDAVDENGKVLPSVCFASQWYDVLSMVMFKYVDETGFSMFIMDGPYGGGSCYSKDHLHHIDSKDSVYWQNRLQNQLMRDLKEKNVFINQPDEYFYSGGNKVGMGYDEYQFSLPRWEDVSVSRATMYDDTFHRLPTQGWMFLPLLVYHSGGDAAKFEPLSKHYIEYEWALAQYFGYGVMPIYKGDRLYDSPETEALVKKWVDFYKLYRDILTSDIVHVRRPDMQDYDCILHVNPFIANKGMAMVFNPTDSVISRKLTLPLYYTGITTEALVQQEGAPSGVRYTLERDYTITLPLSMEPKSITWYLIQS